MDLDDLDRESAEAAATRSLESRLGPLLSLAQRVDSLFDRAMRAVADSPRPGPAAKVGLILANRTANDVRACSILSRQGYGIQGLVLASSIFEAVGALSYVGYDDARATEWATHKDSRRTYPRRVSDGLAATAAIVGASDQGLFENLQQGYEYVCMAKHANPSVELIHGMQTNPSGDWAFAMGPDAQFLGALASARALWYSVSLGGLAVHVALGHCSDDGIREGLRREAMALGQHRLRLEPWYLTVIYRTSNAPDGDRLQAEALATVTKSLESETDRLRIETARIRRAATRKSRARLH